MSNFQKSTSNNSSKPKRVVQNTSFVEALKNIGSGTVKSLKDDVASGVVNDVFDSTFSSPSTANNNFFDNHPSPDMFRPDWNLEQDRVMDAEVDRRQRHRELNLTPIFDRRDQEIKAQIKSLREELVALAKDLSNLGSSVQTAIEGEISQPGTYHVHYFEKLKKFIINLRRQVNESSSWLEISSSRKQAKNHYWGNVKKSGTKFMLSHDRNVATQTG
jgi:hypothetical protein